MALVSPLAESLVRRAAEIHAEFMFIHRDQSRLFGDRITAEGKLLEEFAAIAQAWSELCREAIER